LRRRRLAVASIRLLLLRLGIVAALLGWTVPLLLLRILLVLLYWLLLAVILLLL
jgi:hypothetical protein